MKTVFFVILGTSFLFTACNQEPEYFCSESGVEYLKVGAGVTPHLSKIGIPVHCEK